MEKHQYGFLLILSIIFSLGLVSFVSCVIAESKKAKKVDVKLDDKLCYLPESRAFGFGIAALICLVIAQIIGNLVICSYYCSRKNRNSFKGKKITMGTTLVVLSWISCVLAVILLSSATSMSRRQSYGKGWLGNKCYVVKDGVYTGSGVLVLLTTACTIGSAILTIRKAQLEQGKKIHAQAG